ncbi:MAG: tetratricopeptide repeat protein [Magnetococcales bacterium]|nr:tetratricopeptide repeat protein [Magnetococcales bacterium]
MKHPTPRAARKQRRRQRQAPGIGPAPAALLPGQQCASLVTSAEQTLDRGDSNRARELYLMALALRPREPTLLNALGLLETATGAHAAAIDHFRAALAALPPGTPPTTRAQLINNLGWACWQQGDTAAAADTFVAALYQDPTLAGAHNNLGLVRNAQGRAAEALAAFDRAVALDPRQVQAHENRASLLHRLGHLEAALEACQTALCLDPGAVDTLVNLGVILQGLDRVEAAETAFRQALRRNPGHPGAHLNLGYTLLLQGRFREGWREHEWRWRDPQARPFLRTFSQPVWDGSPLNGATLLVHAEQGFGDTLQFVRLLPLAAARGAGRLVLECQPSLQALLAGLADQVVARGAPLPPCDRQIPLLGLPLVLGIDDATIPSPAGYLPRPPPDRSRPSPAIGLVWQGGAESPTRQARSIPFALLEPLLRALPQATWVSLQTGPAATDPEAHPWAAALERPPLPDFAATARVMAGLDLIVTIDTAAAHLAGALGCPVWTLLPRPADWRWLRQGETSPWYDRMGLFRQMVSGQWPDVVTRVVSALTAKFS